MNTQDFINAFDTFTRRYLVWWFYGMAIIEIIALALRAKGIHVQLVSQVARATAFKGLPTLAYFMAGMSVHWFITWRAYPWNPPWGSILGIYFWAVGVAYFVADMLDPNYLYWPLITQWLRYPPVVAVLGMVNALICFPQNSLWTPGNLK